MRDGSSRLRLWVTFLGGLLTLLACAELYVLIAHDDVSHGFGRRSRFLSELSSLPGGWMFHMFFGVLLVHLSNARHEIGHWHTLIAGLRSDSNAIYEAVSESVAERETPFVMVCPIVVFNNILLGHGRRYLRVTSGYFRFEVSALPCGKDFGISWRCYYRCGLFQRTCLALPVLGWLLYFLFFRYTTYTEDRGIYFRAAIQASVESVVQIQLEEHGLRELTPQELQPVTIDMRLH